MRGRMRDDKARDLITSGHTDKNKHRKREEREKERGRGTQPGEGEKKRNRENERERRREEKGEREPQVAPCGWQSPPGVWRNPYQCTLLPFRGFPPSPPDAQASQTGCCCWQHLRSDRQLRRKRAKQPQEKNKREGRTPAEGVGVFMDSSCAWCRCTCSMSSPDMARENPESTGEGGLHGTQPHPTHTEKEEGELVNHTHTHTHTLSLSLSRTHTHTHLFFTPFHLYCKILLN